MKHHAALPWPEISRFMADLSDREGMGALALWFTILTAARTGEAIGATWSEVHRPAATWTIPAARMKAGRDHRVPLTDASMAVLREIAPLRDDAAGSWVFPGARTGHPLSGSVFLTLLRRMDRGDLTAHGFRSTFRDWAARRSCRGRARAHPRRQGGGRLPAVRLAGAAAIAHGCLGRVLRHHNAGRRGGR